MFALVLNRVLQKWGKCQYIATFGSSMPVEQRLYANGREERIAHEPGKTTLTALIPFGQAWGSGLHGCPILVLHLKMSLT
jgi:hypothetical protein